MKRIAIGCILALLCVPATAQFFHKISFEHATDCPTGITTGRARQLCVDLDDGALWRCEPSAGDCDTAGEWKAVGGTDTTCNDAGVVCLFAASVSEGGPATTATALAANGGNCSVGSYPLGVDDAGVVESCTDASTETDSIVATHAAISGAHHTATTDLLGPDGDKGDITVGSSGTTLTIDSFTEPIYWPAGAMVEDGTNCATPDLVTINSGPKQYTVICTDNDSSTLYGNVGMPDSWDGGTVTMELQYLQTAADTSALNSDIAAQCHAAGETVDSTWGTEVAIDDAAVTGSNAVDHTTSAAVTPAGTCASGDSLWWRWQMDATGTTTAVSTLHILGLKLEYTSTFGD